MQANNEIKFGTDGWRGIISESFTFENVRRVAQAIADYYNQASAAKGRAAKIAVGYDTRFLSDKYARAVSEVLADNGIEVSLSDRPLPTPALSFAVPHRKLTAGVMITASHNPAEYNGIKIKTAEGGAAGMEITREVERLLVEKPIPRNVSTAKKGNVKEVDFTNDYVEFLRGYVDLERLKKADFKVLVDPMHGSGNSFIAEVLKATKIRLDFVRADINPSFEGLRPEPILENLRATEKQMKKGIHDLCLVLDGDADRIASFAGKGEFINPQKILGLLILHLVQDRKMTGAVVKTLVGTNLIDKITGFLGLKLYETPVGFKYISELMVEKDILIGGEEAGGIGFKGYIPERDGTLAGLLLLEMMAYRKQNMEKILKAIESQFGRYYYLREHLDIGESRLDVQRVKQTKRILGKNVVSIKHNDGVKLICDDESWLMLRASGTEPIVRVYAETKSAAHSAALIDFGRKLVKHALLRL